MMSAAPELRAPGLRCPCLSGETYGACCAPLHRDETLAPTAVRLMRSRYSAFALGDTAYLSATWHPSTRPSDLELDSDQHWIRLDIENSTGGGLLATTGTVEFTAYYRAVEDGRTVRGEQHENSRFLKEGGRWFYVDEVTAS